jgi:hypothetical protein
VRLDEGRYSPLYNKLCEDSRIPAVGIESRHALQTIDNKDLLDILKLIPMESVFAGNLPCFESNKSECLVI